jgi:hypothetical protein
MSEPALGWFAPVRKLNFLNFNLMKNIIPKQTKTNLVIFKNLSIKDLIFVFCFVCFFAGTLLLPLPWLIKVPILIILIPIFIFLI